MYNKIYYLLVSRPDLVMKLNISKFSDVPKIHSLVLKASLNSPKDKFLWEIFTKVYNLPFENDYYISRLRKREVFNFLCDLYYIQYAKQIYVDGDIKSLINNASPVCFLYKNFVVGYKPIFLQSTEDFTFLDFYGRYVNFYNRLRFFILLEFENKSFMRIKLFNILHNFLLCSSLGLKYIVIKKEIDA